MGLPYSKQIHAAFNQVTPLVAAGFEVLETTKNIAVLLAWIEVLTFVVLSLILMSLTALLITTNPDLEEERKAIVTPVMKWLSSNILKWVEFINGLPRLVVVICSALFVIGTIALWWTAYQKMHDDDLAAIGEVDTGEEAIEGTNEAEGNNGNDKKDSEIQKEGK